MKTPTLVWFRQDLRISDHAALSEAAKLGPVIPVYIHDPVAYGAWAPGGASRWWLHHSLSDLDKGLKKKGSALILRRGETLSILLELLKSTGSKRVFWSRCYEPSFAASEKKILSALVKAGVDAKTFLSGLLFEPESIRTGIGGPYQVFTPYWRACQAAPDPVPPLPAPKAVTAPATWPASLALTELELLPKVNWAEGLRSSWKPGFTGARALLEDRIEDTLLEYQTTRDIPAQEGTSRLSPHLHFGEIGIREVWAAINGRLASLENQGRVATEKESLLAFRRQLIWREFAHHLLVHFPHTPTEPLRPKFSAFPWRTDHASLKAWQQGRTGYPYVDAGMRQLWATGWMHNRVRMTAASFLVKHLLLPWQEGAKWFWDTLVDADLAQNTLGWQWIAGSGADAAPYFRIFHPVTQGERFDPMGEYVKRWVPELAGMDAKWIHRVWEAPGDLLEKGGVTLGKTYPKPIVDHAQARARALAAYYALPSTASKGSTAR